MASGSATEAFSLGAALSSAPSHLPPVSSPDKMDAHLSGEDDYQDSGGHQDIGTSREHSQWDVKDRGDKETAAALVIQKHYRGYAARKKSKSMSMGNEARWDDLMKGHEAQNYATEQLDNKNDVHSRWKRGVKAAARLQAGDAIHPSSSNGTNAEAGPSRPHLDDKTRKARKARFWGKLTAPTGKARDEDEELPFSSKALEQQHWLEMIDGKHRYGSNLKFYFRAWKEAETKDNFFRWLDRGDGKDLDLEELPREILEKEKIKYLSAEQRLKYLIEVDEQGRLRWAHSGELVDTAAGKWRDSNGDGIVPDETYVEAHAPDGKANYASPGSDAAPRPAAGEEGDGDDSSDASSDSYGALSDLDEDEAEVERRRTEDGNWLARKFKAVTPAGMNKELIKKTLRGNTWIYASDMKMNMFVGIKKRGVFQHSSFTAGGKVTSAGIIVIKQGYITKLNPHSGHYRSTIQHYRAFISQLEEQGADLSRVKVGKVVMQMWGLSKYTAITKGEKSLLSDFKRVLHLKHDKTEAEKSAELQKGAEAEAQAEKRS